MFGLKALLMEPEDGKSGAGAGSGNSALANIMQAAYERPDETPTEGEESIKETVGDPLLIQGQRDIEKRGTSSSIGAPTTAAGPGKADIRMKGEAAIPIPSDLALEAELIKQKEKTATQVQAFTSLNAGRALAQTKAMAQEILAEDYAQMDELNNTSFKRWQEEDAQLRQDIDDARALRVNRNRYMQNIGRSGRVSSVLAATVSQLAAGAGNPNLAWNRLKSAIDYDIQEQKDNIELEFAGIEVAQNQQDREMDKLDKYYAFEEKARAVAFAGLEAQISVILQRAQNENEYTAYQMISDRARAEYIAAVAAANAKNTSLYLDAPVRSRYEQLLKQKKWAAAQALLQQEADKQIGSAQPVDTSIETFDQYGNPVIFGEPGLQGGQPEASQMAPEGPQAAPPAARVAKRRNAGPGATSQGEQVVTTASETQTEPAPPTARPETPAEASESQAYLEDPNAYPSPMLTPEEQDARDKQDAEAEADLRRRARAAVIEQDIVNHMGYETFRKGGYAFVEAERHGRMLQNRNTIAEARDIILDPKNPEIAVAASYEDAVEVLKYDQRNGQKAAYERKHPELYEGWNIDTFRDKDGAVKSQEMNYVKTNWGYMKFSRGSDARHDAAFRRKLQEEINGDYSRAKDVYQQAMAVTNAGTSSFFGFQITDDGITGPSNAEGLNALMEKESGAIGLAIRAMKMLDPSGRLTDKDIIVGMNYMTAVLQNPGVKTYEMLESLYLNVFGTKPSEGDVRRALNKTLKAMATKLSDAVVEKYNGNIVLSYEQDQQFRDKSGEVEQWLRSEDKE